MFNFSLPETADRAAVRPKAVVKMISHMVRKNPMSKFARLGKTCTAPAMFPATLAIPEFPIFK